MPNRTEATVVGWYHRYCQEHPDVDQDAAVLAAWEAGRQEVLARLDEAERAEALVREEVKDSLGYDVPDVVTGVLQMGARLDEAERLHEEDEGVIRVWRRRAEGAEARLDEVERENGRLRKEVAEWRRKFEEERRERFKWQLDPREMY